MSENEEAMSRNKQDKKREKTLQKNVISQAEIDHFVASVRSVMEPNTPDVVIRDVFSTEAWKRLSKHQSFCFCFGLETYNQNKTKALAALAEAGAISKVLNEVQSFVTAHTDALRTTDINAFWNESTFGEDWRKGILDLYTKTIPFDVEHRGEIYFYSSEHEQLVMKANALGHFSPEIEEMLANYNNRIVPEIWKERRLILDDERLASAAAG